MQDTITIQTQSDMEFVNQVNLLGSIVHKYRPNAQTIVLTIAVKGREEDEVNYPNVVFYGEDIVEAIDKSFIVEEKNYPRVEINAIVETSRKTMEDGKVRYYQNIVGQSIRKAQTNMEQLSGKRGVGNKKAESKNDVCLMGTVNSVYPMTREDASQPFGVILTLRTVINGHTEFPKVVCFRGTMNYALELQQGDVVCATGFLRTKHREMEDGGHRRYESVIATEIVKKEVE